MPTHADFFNAPTDLTYKGVTYKLRQPTQLEQGEYQRWMEQCARDAVARSADDDEQRQRDRDAVNTAIGLGEYEWGGELCVRRLRTVGGLAKLVQIVLAEQAVTYDMAREMVETQLTEVAAALIAGATDDPKALAATLGALGLPNDFFSRNSSTRRSTSRGKRSRRRATRN